MTSPVDASRPHERHLGVFAPLVPHTRPHGPDRFRGLERGRVLLDSRPPAAEESANERSAWRSGDPATAKTTTRELETKPALSTKPSRRRLFCASSVA